MKKYCKNVDIYDLDHATAAVLRCLDKAHTRRRYDAVKMFAKAAGISHEEARALLRWRGAEYERVARVVTKKLLDAYRSGKLQLRTAALKYVSDGSSGKQRAVAMIPVWQLMLDHIACAGLADLFRRIGYHQYSGLPGRGAVAAVQRIRRWLHRPDTKYAAHLDVAKCYQTIDRGRLMVWLRERVKNDVLLALVEALINTSPTAGLGIGSFLSQNLATVYLAEIYHEAAERAAKIRRCRNGENKRVRLMRHVLFYMDDIFLFGSSSKDLHKACKLVAGKAAALGLKIKPDWRVLRVKGKNEEGQVLDAMGFKITRDYLTVRRRVFLRARRVVLRAHKRMRVRERLALTQARQIISYAGYFAHSDSGHFSKKYDFPAVIQAAKRVISKHDKQHANKI